MKRKVVLCCALLLITLGIGFFVLIEFSGNRAIQATERNGKSVLVNTPREIISISKVNETKEVKYFKNDMFMHTSVFDEKHNRIIAPTYSPGKKFAGLTVYNMNTDEVRYDKMDGFGPIHISIYEGKILIDSAKETSKSGKPFTRLGIYDLHNGEFSNTFELEGVVKNIYTVGDTAYISSLDKAEARSNIYSYNFQTGMIEKLLVNSNTSIPTKLHFYENTLFGLYVYTGKNTANENTLVTIEHGQIKNVTKLADGAIDFKIVANKIFVLHSLPNQSSWISVASVNELNFEKWESFKGTTSLDIVGNDLVIVKNNEEIYISDTKGQNEKSRGCSYTRQGIQSISILIKNVGGARCSEAHLSS